MDWDKLRVFHVVAEAGSFTHAGDMLNLSQSAVSRQISALEDSLDTVLFHRHARGLLLTEQGEVLYRAADEMFAKVNLAVSRMRDSKAVAGGPLKVTTTVAFGSVWLTPRVRQFLREFREIDLTLILTDSDIDIAMREADVAIRLGPPQQPDLIQRQLMKMTFHIYGSPEYLTTHGIPKTSADLDHHRLIVFGDHMSTPAPVPGLSHLLSEGADPKKPRTPALRVNNVYGMYRAVQSGLGLAMLPDYMSFEQGNLVQVLPELAGSEVDAYFVYPEELRHSNRIGAFRDFLIRSISEAGLK
ncbi:MAG: LysR family transcriptional regulator [Magnetovibrionaceae bacterium]